MVCRPLALLTLVLLFTSLLMAQARPGGGGGGTGGSGGRPSGGGNVTTPTRPSGFPTPGNLPLDNRGPSFLTGKVVVDDGTPLTDPALIQSVCQGNIRNEGYTDSKGHFSLDLNSQREAFGSAQETYSPTSPMMNRGGNTRRNLRDCDLQAVLPGFTSKTVELASKMTEVGTAEVGTIVLHRMAKVEGFTISATSAQAPDKAKKDYQKGREDAAKQKWDAAKEKFSRAVEVYPKYAVAWFELGRVQLQQHDAAGAKASFQHAIQADSRFISPYEELAELALKEKQWTDLAGATEQLVNLNPLSFPQYWYYNAVANYFLQSFDKAEKSANQALTTDVQHRIPKIEYMLGMILVQKKDYQGALAHLRNYVRASPNAADLEVAQKQIAALEKMQKPVTSQNQ
jgi:tetratricopeptide (TPR) repeat protein